MIYFPVTHRIVGDSDVEILGWDEFIRDLQITGRRKVLVLRNSNIVMVKNNLIRKSTNCSCCKST